MPRNPHTYRSKTLDLVREKIKATKLISRLQANALGLIELNPVQQKSIEILLRKSLPDLSAIEHVGDVETRFVIQAPVQAANAAVWLETCDVTLADTKDNPAVPPAVPFHGYSFERPTGSFERPTASFETPTVVEPPTAPPTASLGADATLEAQPKSELVSDTSSGSKA